MTETRVPWYRRCVRWGQTNLTELDPVRYDGGWWREQWRRTAVQGVIINAGGIVAYYPSALPLQHRAAYLGERDLFGEVCAAAREEGLAVLARMDCNRVHEPMFEAHPDWLAVDAEGKPYRAGPLYVTCIQSPYYDTFIPGILREVIERYAPEGFADNSWSGLGRDHICYCEHCRRKFEEACGMALPRKADWEDAAYRAWIRWSYARRLEVWELYNRTTQGAGGADCLWIGMNSGSILHQAQRLRPTRALYQRSAMVLLDSQSRSEASGFQANGDMGKLVHELAGWEVVAPESMAMYQSGNVTFRVASRPVPEARMWMVEGFAGGIQPWWHHIGAYHEDRRQYRTAAPVMQWHAANERYLVDREPMATVGVLWSQDVMDFYGRDAAHERVEAPYRGVMQALIRARIPYLPVDVADLAERAGRFAALVLPNVGALSREACGQLRAFVQQGGGLVATGETSLYDEEGERRADFGLADVFGAHATGEALGTREMAGRSWDDAEKHTYLRLHPELRAGVDGPQVGDEPDLVGARHPVLEGFEETDLLPFGGRLEVVEAASGVEVPLSFVPPFPIYPPETAWMGEADSGKPALVLSAHLGGRVAYLPASLDAGYAYGNLPDHARLLANLVRWAAAGRIPLQVEGAGLIDCHLYRQPGRVVVHLVNLSHPGTWRAPLHELLPVGPLTVRVQLPGDVKAARARLLVAGDEAELAVQDGWVTVGIARVEDHEVVIVE